MMKSFEIFSPKNIKTIYEDNSVGCGRGKKCMPRFSRKLVREATTSDIIKLFHIYKII